MGAVLDAVKRHVPASYRALVSVSNSYYGSTDLQYSADFVQYRLFATVPGATNEANWNRSQLELIGILTTLQFIPAAVDYWGDVIASQSLTGTNENNSWFDRRAGLWDVFKRLTEEAKGLAEEVGVSLGVESMLPQISYGDNGRDILLTPDPANFSGLRRDNFYDTLIWDIEE